MSEIRIENLRKVYDVPRGKEVAVEGSTLTVPDGDFLTLLGPSGCGKSTTLRCIAGLENQTGGNIYYDEDEVSDRLAQERDISMVFQEIALYPHMQCIDNIAYPLKVRGVPKGERYERAREVAKEEREELHEKLEEFAPASDNLEEVFENKEQIEISQYYERMPKPTIVATEEFLHGEVKFTELDKKSKKELAEEGLTTPSRSESVSSAQNN